MRCLGCELADEMRGEDGGNGRGDAQPDCARLSGGDPAHRGVCCCDLVEDDLRAGQQFGSGAGHRDSAGGAGEQRRTQLAL